MGMRRARREGVPGSGRNVFDARGPLKRLEGAGCNNKDNGGHKGVMAGKKGNNLFFQNDRNNTSTTVKGGVLSFSCQCH